jgi:hypothetical protein
MRTIRFTILAGLWLLVSSGGAAPMSASLVDPNVLVHRQIIEGSQEGQAKIRIRADLFESAYSVDRVETEVQGQVMIIKVYEKPVFLVPKESLRSAIDLEVVVPDVVKEIRFYNDSAVLWSRR